MIFQTSNVSICNGSIKDPFARGYKALLHYYYGIREIVTVISLHLRVLLSYYYKVHPLLALRLYILSHDRYLPDTLVNERLLLLIILFVVY